MNSATEMSGDVGGTMPSLLTATGVFVALGVRAVVPPLAMNLQWIAALGVVLVLSLVAGCVEPVAEDSVFVKSVFQRSDILHGFVTNMWDDP